MDHEKRRKKIRSDIKEKYITVITGKLLISEGTTIIEYSSIIQKEGLSTRIPCTVRPLTKAMETFCYI